METNTEKRFAWLDTVRILASFLVILSHFAYFFNFDRLRIIRNYIAEPTGNIGVFLFFAISGYLVSHSLAKGGGIARFYKSKIVHIWLPFVTSYFFLSFLFIGLSVLRPEFIQQTPLGYVFLTGGDYGKFLFGLIPLEGLYSKAYWFVGEWFIGTLVTLYIISPILNEAAKRRPLVMLIFFTVLAIGVFFVAREELRFPFWFFLSRIPEFYLGMLLYLYRDWISIHFEYVFRSAFLVMVSVFAVRVFLSEDPFFGNRFVPSNPSSFLFSFPAIVFIFMLCEKVNNRWDLSKFNEYSEISYSFMLIQHVVLNVYFAYIQVKDLSKFGVLVSFLLVLGVTVYLAKKITAVYKPVEERLLRKK
jgi:peptidoglycan/LPS O-acetylase OafA/YrhL